jgi:nucleoside-diphosphate-sugar epimerase
VHVDDAAAVTAAALGCVPGAYNIVGDDPTPQWSWLPAFARAVSAPPPPRMTEQEALDGAGPDTVYSATRLRGAANTKAKRGLNFHPRLLEWLSAGRSGG